MYNQSDNGDIYPTPRQQRIYWGIATLNALMSVCALLYLFRKARGNKAFRKQAVRAFWVMFLGDLMFVCLYVVYHAGNFVAAMSDPGFVLDDAIVCKIASYGAITGLSLEMFGMALVSYIPFKLVKDAKHMVRCRYILSGAQWKMYWGAFFTWVLVWCVESTVLDHGGSYKGLYCGFKSWRNVQGAMCFLLICTTFSVMTFCYGSAYWAIVSQVRSSTAPESGSEASTKMQLKVANQILKTGCFMVAALLTFWGPFTISVLLNVIGVRNVPVELDMAAGILLKMKPIADCFILLNNPTVVKGSKQLRTTSRGVASTTLTRAVGSSPSRPANQSSQMTHESE